MNHDCPKCQQPMTQWRFKSADIDCWSCEPCIAMEAERQRLEREARDRKVRDSVAAGEMIWLPPDHPTYRHDVWFYVRIAAAMGAMQVLVQLLAWGIRQTAIWQSLWSK